MNQLYYQSYQQRYQHRYQLIDHCNTQSHDWVLRIDPLQSYQFRRQPGNLDLSMATALTRIRQKYSKIRLFYSGGLDSHFVMQHCLHNKIHLDEIYSVIKTPFQNSLLMALDEGINSAHPFLQEVSEQLSRTKVHTPVLTHEFYNKFYAVDDYWKYSYSMFIVEPSRVCNIINGFALDNKDVCNLTGIDTPFVYWDQGWKFCFVDLQFMSEHSNQQASLVHSLSLQDPEFLQAYVNAIVDQMELYPDHRTRFSWHNVLKYGSKFIQRLVPEMQSVNGQMWGLRLPKNSGIVPPATASFMEKNLHANFRSFMYWQQAQQEQPAWLDRWINHTNWAWVERCQQFGGVFSDQFVLHD